MGTAIPAAFKLQFELHRQREELRRRVSEAESLCYYGRAFDTTTDVESAWRASQARSKALADLARQRAELATVEAKFSANFESALRSGWSGS